MEINKRNPVIDVLKGLGIILMVIGHSGFPFTRFIYLFHMAVFFMASGFCYKKENAENIKSCLYFIKRRFISLWLPYVIWTSIFSILNNFFIFSNIYTNNPLILNYTSMGGVVSEIWTYKDVIKNICLSFLLSGGTRMGGALWFICILMKISILYLFFDFLIQLLFKNNLLIQGIISVVLLSLGYFFHIKDISFLSLDKVFSYYCLFYLGFLVRTLNLGDLMISWQKRITIIIAAFFILFVFNHIGRIELADTDYTNPIFLICASTVGWFFLYQISYFISKSEKLTTLIAAIGKNTIAVVILHFLCFKIVSFIGLILEGSPNYLLACFPIYMNTGVWWVAYTIVGVAIPVSLSMLYKSVKQKIIIKCLQSKQNHIV